MTIIQGTKGPNSVKIEIKKVNPHQEGDIKDDKMAELKDAEAQKDDQRWREQR